MVVFKRKTRMLSLRLSEEEYERLRQKSLAQGSRSVSDYARETLFRFSGGEPTSSSNGLERRMRKLDSEMQVLSRELERLRHFVGLDGPTAPRQAL
jgi:predicted DNA-binding protein